MVSNKLTHRRTTISNPKICKSKLKPLRPPAPEEPPEWPPPYINARITALIGGQQFEASVKLEPQIEPPDIHYIFHDPTIDLWAEVILYTALTPQQIDFSWIHLYSSPYFVVGHGPRVDVQPPTLNLQNSLWRYKIPIYATVEMAIAYPGEP